MVAVKGTTVKTEFKSICDRAYGGEQFVVTRPRDENVVILSEKEYRQLLRCKAYADAIFSGQNSEDSRADYLESKGDKDVLDVEELYIQATQLRLREKLHQIESRRKSGVPDKDARQFGREIRERYLGES